ncbi:MAG: Gfo/Idh/MocA family oxidoreductase [Nanoarchaeota archaeon]
MINAAVIGVGLMGRNHARVIHSLKDVNLVAVSDIDKNVAEAVASEFSCKFYFDYKEMLEKEKIDIISIVVPTKMHKEVAIAAIKKNIHVLLEKPIALSETEAGDIITAAKRSNIKLMIGHIERFNPAIIELKKRLENDELGDIYKIDVQRIGPFPSRIDDVGVIIDLAVHDVDIISHLIDSKPISVHAETQQKLHPKCEDSLTTLLRYENGILAILNINYLSPKKIREISIFGKKGMFKVNYLDQDLRFYENRSYNKNKHFTESFESVSEGKEYIIQISKKEPLLSEIEAFIDCVKNDKPSPVDGVTGLKALQIVHMIEKSSKGITN